MAALDIAEAYTHIPMRHNLHRFLAFSYRNQLYFFIALSFGFNVALYIFTKVLAWPLQTLRIQGVNTIAYLENVVLWHSSPTDLRLQVQQTINRLTTMWFQVNMAKSQPEPQTHLQWLGVLWHPQTGHWQVSQDIRDRICASTAQLLSLGWTTRRSLEALVGLISFACQIHRHLRVYLQPLTRGTALAAPHERDIPHRIPDRLRQDLEFWRNPSIWQHVPQFQLSLPRCFLWTDVSTDGWGALLHPHAVVHAPWEPTNSSFHINRLELRAVRLAIRHFHLSHCHLVVYTDNETVRFTLAHLTSRSPLLQEELKQLLHEVVGQQIFLQPLRIPTELNVVADGLSRFEPLNT